VRDTHARTRAYVGISASFYSDCTASHTWSNAFCEDLSPASFHAIFVIVLRTIYSKIFQRTIETNSTPIYIIYRKFHL